MFQKHNCVHIGIVLQRFILPFLSLLDINECSANNGGCVQNCFDDDGSFHCGCHAGFNLNNNRVTCSGKTHNIYL